MTATPRPDQATIDGSATAIAIASERVQHWYDAFDEIRERLQDLKMYLVASRQPGINRPVVQQLIEDELAFIKQAAADGLQSGTAKDTFIQDLKPAIASLFHAARLSLENPEAVFPFPDAASGSIIPGGEPGVLDRAMRAGGEDVTIFDIDISELGDTEEGRDLLETYIELVDAILQDVVWVMSDLGTALDRLAAPSVLDVIIEGDPGSLGSDGDDRMVGSHEGETSFGFFGDDTIMGRGGDDILHGGEGDDQLFGQGGFDTLLGGAGDDRLSAGSRGGVLEGGVGDDTLIGPGFLFGQEGRDLLRGGGWMSGGEGDDTLIGGNDADNLQGDDGDDKLRGGAGNDTLDGGRGNDVLSGGEGNDLVIGYAGNDRLIAGAGRDTLDGGRGADVFEIGEEATGVVTLFLEDDDKLKLVDEVTITALLSDREALWNVSGHFRFDGKAELAVFELSTGGMLEALHRPELDLGWLF